MLPTLSAPIRITANCPNSPSNSVNTRSLRANKRGTCCAVAVFTLNRRPGTYTRVEQPPPQRRVNAVIVVGGQIDRGKRPALETACPRLPASNSPPCSAVLSPAGAHSDRGHRIRSPCRRPGSRWWPRRRRSARVLPERAREKLVESGIADTDRPRAPPPCRRRTLEERPGQQIVEPEGFARARRRTSSRQRVLWQGILQPR